ncbi:DUF3261 domain-containing protein [Chitinilyticum piscinae]|uniref:DUF3261 domain-containing protein n=1 Tax=Chitinilyticum piscinae TaxID=2866724 RepID=A0A8J7FKL0_9NEIS|nr:DUF3261 domain-containing protein [Chitinilyticum piscinae]MBE9607816.1 DUF3261 domain-containing protein [Chitinilyticum piscinae]
MRAALLFALWLLAGCAGVAEPRVAVADFGVLAQTELVSLQAGEREAAFTARLESDGEVLRVVAITPTGQRLFSLIRRGQSLQTEAGPLWPAAMPLTVVWADIELVHLAMRAPQAGLPAGWTRKAEGACDEWSYRQQMQAKVCHDDGRYSLIRPAYRISVEVLPE